MPAPGRRAASCSLSQRRLDAAVRRRNLVHELVDGKALLGETQARERVRRESVATDRLRFAHTGRLQQQHIVGACIGLADRAHGIHLRARLRRGLQPMHPHDAVPAQQMRQQRVQRRHGRVGVGPFAQRQAHARDNRADAATAALPDLESVAHHVREAGADAPRLLADPADETQIAFARERGRRLRLEQRQVGGRPFPRDEAPGAQVAADVDALRQVLVDVPAVGLALELGRDIEPQHQRAAAFQRTHGITSPRLPRRWPMPGIIAPLSRLA